jgi:hypothetical protein
VTPTPKPAIFERLSLCVVNFRISSGRFDLLFRPPSRFHVSFLSQLESDRNNSDYFESHLGFQRSAPIWRFRHID